MSQMRDIRGFQIATYQVDLGSLTNMMETAHNSGAGAIRYQIVDPAAHSYQRQQYRDFWFHHINQIISLCFWSQIKGSHLKIIVDCHSPYGGEIANSRGGEHRLLQSNNDRREWEFCWLEGIKRIHAAGAEDRIAAYDLLNEPAGNLERWKEVAAKLTRKIRQMTRKPVIFGFTRIKLDKIKDFKPLNEQNVWYQFHYYKPHQVCLHGVNPEHSKTLERAIAKMSFDFHRKQVQPVRDWQRLHKRKIYVGEVGCSVHSGVSGLFFSDVLKLFNSYNWGWSIHALREHSSFNYEGTGAWKIIEDRINE